MQKRNICPYYKNGFCISPALDKPTDAVVSSSRCFGQFKTCRYFLDNEDSKVGLEIYNEDKTMEQGISFYPKANVLESPIDSGCENYQLIKTEKGLIAYCKVLKRALTTQQAMLCNREFLKCPFRNLI